MSRSDVRAHGFVRAYSPAGPSGGRTWWAHFEFTRINIEPIILRKEIEEALQGARELANAKAFMGSDWRAVQVA